MALLAYAIIVPNPFGGDDWLSLPTRLQLENSLYLVIFIALSTLTYSPRQVVWTGLFAAFCWAVAAAWIAQHPGVGFVFDAGGNALPSGTPAERTAVFNNPNHVNALILIKQLFLLLIVTFLLSVAVARSRALALRQIKTERERAQLARYFSANLVDELADADRPLGEIRSQTVAIMFVDIVGFTRLAEGEAPATVIGLLREFHARMQAIVFAHGGTLDKYLGDGLMASFGTPHPGPRDAANALAAARAMADAMREWNRARVASDAVPVAIGIGIHLGPVVLGDIGGENRLEFATIGDTVNVASRLETATRELKAEIVASADLVAAVRRELPEGEAAALLDGFKEGEVLALRGRNAPIAISLRPRAKR